MKKAKKYISLLLSAALIFTFCGCSKKEKAADSYLVQIKPQTVDTVLNEENSDIFCDTTDFKEYVRISKSDMFALCFSEESYGISVYDAGSNTMWKSLPEEYKGENAGVIELTVLIDGNEYTLNSQSDSKAMNSTSYEIKEDSIVISYGFKRTLSDGTKVDITVPCEYKGADGTMSVSIDCSEIVSEGSDSNVVIKSVALLPYLNADGEGSEDDFILIPDGCGAVIDISGKSDEIEKYEVAVYGNGEGACAAVPAFGMKVSDGAFVAVIDEGDAMATIKACTASAEKGSNRVYAEFEITPTLVTKQGVYVSNVSYSGKIKLSYRFISKENTDYTGMATVAEELFIRNGSFATADFSPEGEYPFNFKLIGISEDKAVTGYSECYDILSSLKGKGINNINLRYENVILTEFSKSGKIEASYNEKLGDKDELEELFELATQQSITVYPEAEIFTFEQEPYNCAVNLSGEKLFVDGNYYCAAEEISDNVNEVLYLCRQGDFAGLCISDGSGHLYSDFSQGAVTLREDTRNLLYNQLNSVTATGRLMVDGGNLYSVKYADVVVNLPDEAYYADEEKCTQVPFLQVLLHGVCDYSLSPLNLSEDSHKAFLKAVEYGAVPYYEWYYDSEEGENDNRAYLENITQAQQQYVLARDTFSDLRQAKITAHSLVAENVYLTVYNNETEIYVNYGEQEVTVAGVSVEPLSFVRVN